MAEQKRVLIFSTAYLPLVGGAEVALKELTDRLGDFSFDLVCAKLKPGLSSRETIGKVKVHRVGFGSTIDKYLLPLIGPLVALRLFGRRGPDLLWSMQASYGGFASLFYSWLRPRVRFLLTVQEGDPPERYAKHAGPFRGLHHAIFRRADQVQSISSFLSRWAKRMGFEGASVLIPNGVNLAEFDVPRSQSERTRIRGEHGFAADDVVLVTASRLVEKNGVDTLIRALSYLPSRCKALIVGGGEDEAALRTLASELGLESRVVFAGEWPNCEIVSFYHASDISIRASRSEGQGISFIESMAAGLPTIGTPVGGIPDFLVEGETGWLCEPDNAESLAAAVERILAMPQEELDRIKERARNLVRERYDWNKIALEMASLFGQMIASKRILIATGIYPPEIGGPATYVPLLAAGLVAAGDRVRVVTFGNQKTETGEAWSVSVVPKTGSAPWRYMRMFLRVLHLAKGVDLVYAQTPSSDGLPASLAARLRRIPFALKVVGDYAWEAYQNAPQEAGSASNELLDTFLEKKHGGSIGLLEKIERFVAKQAKTVIVPSDYLASVVERWHVDKSKIKRIHNAVEIVPPSRDRDMLRQAFGVEEKRVLFTVVRCVPWKGVDFLMGLLPSLPDETILVVAGDGPMKEAWERQAMTSGIAGRLRFLGSVSRHVVADWNAAADAFVLASGYEGYPHVVIEALAVGRPCFVSDQAGNKEMGRLFPEGVTVLPYREAAAWIEALSKPFTAHDPSALRFQTAESLVRETRAELHRLCES